MQWNKEYRTSADVVFPLLDLWTLARLVYSLLVFLLLVWSALARLVCKLLVVQLRKAMVAMVPVETAPLSAL